MKTSTNNNAFQHKGNKISSLLLVTLAMCIFASTSTFSQVRKHKQLLSNVTFKTSYVMKADAASIKEEAERVYASLPPFIVTPPVHENQVIKSAEGNYHFIRPTNELQPIGDEVCLTKTDALGNIEWETKFHGEGFSNDGDNFVRQTKDLGYLIQRTICNDIVETPALAVVTSK